MGITQFSKELIERHLSGVKSVIDFGSQNDYTTADVDPPFISEWYERKGIEYTCIDIAGDNRALKLDWSYPIELGRKFDLVVDGGSSEHSAHGTGFEIVGFHEGHINSGYPKEAKDFQEAYYNCWKNKFDLCKRGGIIISENPKHLNWPGHCYTWIEEKFYHDLFCLASIKILELGTHAACGNNFDGNNIYAAIKKTGDVFPTFQQFGTCETFES